MNFLSAINKVPWKYVISANMMLIVGAATVATLKPVTQSTYHQTKAANHLPEPLMKIVVDPAQPPRLINPDIGWGKVGDAVVVRGENLGTKPFGVVRIGQVVVPNDNLIDWQPSFIIFNIPEGVTTATISITVPNDNGKELILTTKNSLEIKEKNPEF